IRQSIQREAYDFFGRLRGDWIKLESLDFFKLKRCFLENSEFCIGQAGSLAHFLPADSVNLVQNRVEKEGSGEITAEKPNQSEVNDDCGADSGPKRSRIRGSDRNTGNRFGEIVPGAMEQLQNMP